jgi:hypothetical protein
VRRVARNLSARLTLVELAQFALDDVFTPAQVRVGRGRFLMPEQHADRQEVNAAL